jgi:hypothetical protein
MKPAKVRAVEMVRQIRDRHARRLARKATEDVIAFYRAAGEAALTEVQRRTKTGRRKAG